MNEAEASHLERIRKELGLTPEEAMSVHARLGWEYRTAAPSTDAPPITSCEWKPERAHSFLGAVRQAVGVALGLPPLQVALDDVVDIGEGELWLQVGPKQGTAAWFLGRRLDRVRVAVGFYSRNEVRDPAYRAARRRIEALDMQLMPGWKALSRNSRSDNGLALETTKRFSIAELSSQEAIQDVARMLIVLTKQAQAASASTQGVAVPAEPTVEAPPVSTSVPDDFPLAPLTGSPRLQGSVWLARILWALEYARRSNAAPINSAEIARLLSEHGVRVPGTNTARAFRTPQDDPRRTGLCEEHDDQRYAITPKGRRALYEWLSRTSDNTD